MSIESIKNDARTVIGDGIVEFESMDWERVDEDMGECHTSLGEAYQEKRLFLGTVFALMPSGKYYTPFANSNVENCPKCSGRGLVPSNHDKPLCEAVMKLSGTFRKECVKLFGHFYTGQWPEPLMEVSDAMNKLTREYSVDHECKLCGGLGSVEAYHDEVWRDEAEAWADSHNAWIENSECDPCDLILVRTREIPEEKS